MSGTDLVYHATRRVRFWSQSPIPAQVASSLCPCAMSGTDLAHGTVVRGIPHERLEAIWGSFQQVCLPPFPLSLPSLLSISSKSVPAESVRRNPQRTLKCTDLKCTVSGGRGDDAAVRRDRPGDVRYGPTCAIGDARY
eukprot:1687014-Rhodomonas_salina.2